MILNNIGIFFCSFLSLFLFRKLAKAINLVDSPNARKHHAGSVPLVGGLAIFVVVFSFLFAFPDTITTPYLYLSCAITLLVVGVFDDLLDISFKFRLLLQVVISGLMMFVGGLVLQNLGMLVAPFTLDLSFFGYFVTVITVVGAINAFNMVDGIDGLLGGLSIVTFGSLGLLFFMNGQLDLMSFCLAIIVATLPYILLNLGLPLGQRFKVFMGDAGSTVIGFTVVWLLIEGSQSSSPAISPVTALWIAAIPIMDAVYTIFRRIKKGQSPFQPDRKHLHHILQRLGLNSSMTLVTICSLASVFAAVGVIGEMMNVPEYIMFYSFIVMFLVYYRMMSRIWKVSVKIRRLFGVGRKSKKVASLAQRS
ncbi:UDP-N-acetylglucosamine--undecaprenyl-phosphate N-acetylglucosaminephosphotransferase [Pseudoalteromonas sp. '520P1 No. 423']|uniref:UDP-N-acetylglucosamine--undecaprenyl-phosphate N-acetylglucosaminephosphotransferase n=2 Tax=unclassified Pseudoalteromonas TaxID=194690 RepID=UPI0007511329